jgi:hypothetical protein
VRLKPGTPMVGTARTALLVGCFMLAPGVHAGDERPKPGDPIPPDFVNLMCIDYAESRRLNIDSFLSRCEGAAALTEFVAVLEQKEWPPPANAPHAGELFRAAATGTCIFGDCPSPLSSLLAEEAMQDFYEQHCCYIGTTHLYIALFTDGRRAWVYVSDPGIAKPLLEGCQQPLN